MNHNALQGDGLESKSCRDCCTTNFEVTGRQVANSYKCATRKLTSSEVWYIQKQKKAFNFKGGI